MLNTRALLLASVIGTILQVAMVIAGHYKPSVSKLFAVGGMGLSLVAGALYAVWARGGDTMSMVIGGLAAGAICAFLGILVSYLLKDVPASLLALGTLSSAVTGALGGWLASFALRSGLIAAVLIPMFAGKAQAQDVSPVISEGIIAAPVDSVWAAWATSSGLRSWLAPHAEIELRVGGLMRANYDPAGVLGDSGTIDNQVLSFEPRRMLSIRVTKAPNGFPFPKAIQQMWTVLYLEEDGPDRTRLRVVSLGFEPDEESQRMRAFFARGNAMTVQALQRRFEKRTG